LKHHLAGTRFNVEPCSKVPDDVRLMFLKHYFLLVYRWR
jgi:hypothetical protein